MTYFLRFLMQSLVLALVLAVACAAILSKWDSAAIHNAAWVGLTIGYLNALIGFAILSWGYTKSHNVFFASVYGGIIFRFLLIFALLFILIWALNMERVALVVPLVAAYFIFLVLEIFHITRFSRMEREAE